MLFVRNTHEICSQNEVLMYTRAELPIRFILRAFFMLYTFMKKMQ